MLSTTTFVPSRRANKARPRAPRTGGARVLRLASGWHVSAWVVVCAGATAARAYKNVYMRAFEPEWHPPAQGSDFEVVDNGACLCTDWGCTMCPGGGGGGGGGGGDTGLSTVVLRRGLAVNRVDGSSDASYDQVGRAAPSHRHRHPQPLEGGRPAGVRVAA